MKSTCLLMLLGLLVSSAAAHSLYAEFPADLSSNSKADIWIAYGHGGSADTQIDSLPVARLISPDQEQSDLELAPYQDGLKGSVALQEPGCYILDLQMQTSLFNPAWFGAAGAKSLVEKYGRVLMPAGSGQGFDWSSGSGPGDCAPDRSLRPEVRRRVQGQSSLERQAASGSYSAVVTRSPQDVLMIQHVSGDRAGREQQRRKISFETTRPGLWVLSFEATIDESGTWTADADDSCWELQERR